MSRLIERAQRLAPAPRFKVSLSDGVLRIAVDDEHAVANGALLTHTLATADTVFADGVLLQLAKAAREGKQLTSEELNRLLATVHAIGPRDPTETLLACQMAVVHAAAMSAARRLNHSETIQQQDSNSNIFNKLTRTYVAQMEALKRYRTGGEQSVRVTHHHLNVNANQALVGINQGVQGGGGR